VTRADQRKPGLDRREHNPAVLRHDCELRRLSRAQSIFGGTTEIMKEIIGRGLAL
jgi:alkylation response protein AidB-like acyl-CoA dehydrogenase